MTDELTDDDVRARDTADVAAEGGGPADAGGLERGDQRRARPAPGATPPGGLGRPRTAGPVPRTERRRLSHLDRAGRPRMVDVSAKPPTARRAVSEAFVSMSPETLSLVIDGGNEKGDVLGVAELAGVMGGKRTSELIPLCHPLPLTDLVVAVTPDRAGGGLRVRAEAATTGPTGVEMEALTAATVAALTVYDMVKGVDRGVEISAVRLVSKTGGKSGDWHRGTDASRARDDQRPRRSGPRTAGQICGERRRSGRDR